MRHKFLSGHITRELLTTVGKQELSTRDNQALGKHISVQCVWIAQEPLKMV